MKIALVGIGKIAIDQHIPAINSSRDWELAATVSRHGGIENIENFADIQTMLDARPDIECVSLCLPPVPRFDYAVAALKAGRHVMLEKPPGATVSECRTLETMAHDGGVTIYATWHSREAAQVDLARDWLKDKRLKSLRIIWKEDVRRWHPGQKWIWEAGGLGVFDPGINAFSILTKILPVPVHVTSAELRFPENCETPIAADITFAHPLGAAVTAEFDFLEEGTQTWSMIIDTDGGELLLEEGGAKLTIDGVEQADSAALAETEDGSNPLLGGEYTRLYARMANLVRAAQSEMDLRPFMHVSDCFLLGKRVTVAPFHE
jgi:D-galactose 1-dehydrogenase